MNDGENHLMGTCDNCSKVGKLGFIVGGPDKSHLHSCKKEDCKEALEARQWGAA